MRRDSLDIYDELPKDMIKYLRHYGRHFNRKLCEFAVNKMKSHSSSTGRLEVVKMINKDSVDQLLEANGIKIENNELYDYVYVANMCKADFLGSSIVDERCMCLYIKDVIDDPDGYDGLVFNRWYADMCRKGVPIDWEEML